jgi:hypothetical protein
MLVSVGCSAALATSMQLSNTVNYDTPQQCEVLSIVIFLYDCSAMNDVAMHVLSNVP